MADENTSLRGNRPSQYKYRSVVVTMLTQTPLRLYSSTVMYCTDRESRYYLPSSLYGLISIFNGGEAESNDLLR